MHTAVPVGSVSTNTLVTALVYIYRTGYPVWLAIQSNLYDCFVLSAGELHYLMFVALEITTVNFQHTVLYMPFTHL